MKTPTWFSLPLAVLPLFGLEVRGTTTLTGGSSSRSRTLFPADFGSNVSQDAVGITTTQNPEGIVGTPNIGLTWSASGGAGWWHCAWSEKNIDNHVFQMAGGGAGSIYSILFTPTFDTGVVFNGFNFIGSSPKDSYQFRVSLVDVASDSTVWSETTERWTTTKGLPFNNAPAIAANYTGGLGMAYRLDIEMLEASGSGNTQNNIAIDNISFAQTSIPESSTYGIIGMGLVAVGAIVFRRSKKN
ncbi:MAG: PEP-CTERM sorting domain-containing protein [Puniceicoccales bacterium]|jgi:hypothetical protein|nr:PEP-CTERM sorting domain-containing protein [Puniceicoccales bacterium]